MDKSTAYSQFPLTRSARRVLDLIRRHGPVSRAELVSLSGLGAASVTLLTRELIANSLVLEAGRRSGGRGQPAIDLVVNPEAGFTIGISASMEFVGLAVLDFAGQCRTERVHHRQFPTFDAIVDVILQCVEELSAELPLGPQKLIGVGLALSATFNDGDLTIYPSKSMDEWHGTDFVARMAQALNAPVWIENDANAATIAENLLGNSEAFQSFVYLFISEGIGGGAVINGAPWRGARGNAGEFGALMPRPEIRPSIDDLRAFLRQQGLEQSTPNDISELFEADPERFNAWLDRSGDMVSELLFTACASLDPDGVVIGGTMPAEIIQELADRVRFSKPDRRLQGHIIQPPIVVSKLSGELATAIGAATLPFSATPAASD